MTSESRETSRRQVLRAVVAVACCSGGTTAAANTSSGKSVDQITDVSATAATDMFRFEPDLVVLSPGEELTFLNSRSNHTVHSVPELWPEGVPVVGIAHKPEAVIRFDREGFYGFRCKRHGQYGMVMLVVVGQPNDEKAFRSTIETMRAKKRERAGFSRLIDRYATT